MTWEVLMLERLADLVYGAGVVLLLVVALAAVILWGALVADHD
jgi:hypothetical protein